MEFSYTHTPLATRPALPSLVWVKLVAGSSWDPTSSLCLPGVDEGNEDASAHLCKHGHKCTHSHTDTPHNRRTHEGTYTDIYRQTQTHTPLVTASLPVLSPSPARVGAFSTSPFWPLTGTGGGWGEGGSGEGGLIWSSLTHEGTYPCTQTYTDTNAHTHTSGNDLPSSSQSISC